MTINLKNIVPIGRSFDEYKKMFDLDDIDLNKKIIGIGDGPASFNAEMKLFKKHVTSIDPIYSQKKEVIEAHFFTALENIINQITATQSHWNWTYHHTPENLRNSRIKSFKTFFNDYDQGKLQGRYIPGELPNLTLKDNSFDLALCSHFLFLYTDHLDFEFHLRSIMEILRIAKEIRVFPLLSLDHQRSPYVNRLSQHLDSSFFSFRIKKVSYEFQPGGNKMLLIKHRNTKRSGAQAI